MTSRIPSRKSHWFAPTQDVTAGLAIVSPLANASIDGLIYIRGTRSTLNPIFVKVDNGPERPCRCKDGKWFVSFNTTYLTPGNHTITARIQGGGSVSTVINVLNSTIFPGIQVFKLAETGYFNTTNREKFSTLIVGQQASGTVTGTAALDASQQPGRHLLWGWMVNMIQGFGDGLGLSWSEVVANNWVQKDTNGNYLLYPGGNSAMLDFGNPAYVTRWLQNWLTVIFPRFPQAEGLLMDNIINHVVANTGQTPSVYNTDALWREATLQMLDQVGTTLGNAGYYFGGNLSAFAMDLHPTPYNINTGAQWIWWMQQCAPSMHGIAMEYYMRAATTTPVRRIGTATYDMFWTEWETFLNEVNAVGCDFLPWAPIANTTDTVGMTFQMGSFLLDFDPTTGSVLGITPGTDYVSAMNVWNNAWTYEVGIPNAPKDQPSPGLWRRFFTNGAVNNIVLVNANDAGANLNANGHSVAPRQAYIGTV